MRVFTRIAISVAVLITAVTVSCTLLNREGGPEVQVIVGAASFVRDGIEREAYVGLRLKPGDAVMVPRDSKGKVGAGSGGIFVNQDASFQVLQPVGLDSGAIAVERGEYYFVARDGGALTCRFGDMTITMRHADAVLTIDASGRLAEYFVLSGQAWIARGVETVQVGACQGVTLDLAGITKNENAVSGFGVIERRLRGWVGSSAIERAALHGNCRAWAGPDGEILFEGSEAAEDTAWAPAVADSVKPTLQSLRRRGRRAVGSGDPPLPPVGAVSAADTVTEVKRAVPLSRFKGIRFGHITGPRHIRAGREFTLRGSLVGSGMVTGYVWRFSMSDRNFEHKTAEPQVRASFDRAGEAEVTCSILGAGGAVVASQLIRFTVAPDRALINAGGPYTAVADRPVKLRGNAKARFGTITQYEWYFTGGDEPEFASAENLIVQHTYTEPGRHKAVFRVTLSDGTSAVDTAIVNAAPPMPVANAGRDVVSATGHKVNLNGTGSSPNGKIVKYEWDFDGDGEFDWSSNKSGEATHTFKDYSQPVLRVTDKAGYTAVDTMNVVICSRDMAAVVKGGFCIDRYEWPNRRGEPPAVNVSWYEAEKACADAGKRLCSASEWRRACRNDADYKPAGSYIYPYGHEFDVRGCNVLENPASKNALSVSGAFRGCAGALKIYDMSGNVSEWVDSFDPDRALAFGGFYQSGAEENHCEASLILEKDRQYLHTGFRCCK